MFTSTRFYTQSNEYKLLNPEKLLKNGQILNTVNIFQQSQDFSNQMKRHNNDLKLVNKKIKLEKKMTLLFRQKSNKDAKSFEIIPLTAKEKKSNSINFNINKGTLFEFPKLIMNDFTSGALKFQKKINFNASPFLKDSKTPDENLTINEEIKEKIKRKILGSKNYPSPCIIIDNKFSYKPLKSYKNENKRNEMSNKLPNKNNKSQEKGEIEKIEIKCELIQLKDQVKDELKKDASKIELEKRNNLEKKGFNLKKKNSLHLRNNSLNLNMKFEEKKNDKNFILSLKEIDIKPWKIENTQEDEILTKL